MSRQHTTQTPPEVTQTTPQELSGSRVLIVDDSKLARRQMRLFLERDDLQVFEAKSGEEAIWLTGEIDPDLVVMDVLMDGMDGFQTCQRLRAIPEHENLPIIFLTGLSERDHILSGFNAGGVDFITKPFHPTEGMARIRTHLRLQRLQRFRRQYISELENMNQAKDRLLRVASHDLRNPLAAISGLSGFLLDDHSRAPQDKEIILTIQQAAGRMTNLLNDLLDLSALDEGRLALRSEPINLSALVRDMVQLHRMRADEKYISLGTPAAMADDLWTSGDLSMLQRVVENLLSNALKFTQPGGSVSMGCEVTGDRVLLHVDDNGPGIPVEDADRLYREFGRTRNQPTGGESSTGLGLSICMRLVKAHGGTISHANRPEGGTRFTVALPGAMVPELAIA